VGAGYNRTRHLVLHQRSTESSGENAVRRENDDEPGLHAIERFIRQMVGGKVRINACRRDGSDP
jgi:hypothetical protein